MIHVPHPSTAPRDLHGPPLRMLVPASRVLSGAAHFAAKSKDGLGIQRFQGGPVPFVYILKCADGSYYVGSTANLEQRLWQHQNRFYSGYTSARLPVKLVWSAELATGHEAFLFERQIKGWSRAKKQALIKGEWQGIHEIVKHERKEREAERRRTA